MLQKIRFGAGTRGQSRSAPGFFRALVAVIFVVTTYFYQKNTRINETKESGKQEKVNNDKNFLLTKMTIRTIEHGNRTIAQLTLLWQVNSEKWPTAPQQLFLWLLESEHDNPHHRTWPSAP